MKQLFFQIDSAQDMPIDNFWYGEDGKPEVVLNCVGGGYWVSYGGAGNNRCQQKTEKFAALSQALKRMSELVP